ncbi:MAG: redox-regulated ATPase YchF [Chloroflexi bacterium]|nr:redox-regulated ATPase YchF [Chloroflexota bacterium]
MQIGIIGLPLSGKTTIFNALTRGHADVANFASGKLQVHTASVQVPDTRIDVLTKMFNPRKTIYAQVIYNDIAGLARGIGEKGGMDGNLLNQIVQNDALVHVVRVFENDNVPHLEGSISPARDLEMLDTELILSDLGVVERRIERLKTSLGKGGATPQEREAFQRELAQLERFQTTLEGGGLLRDLELSAAELKPLRSLALTTLKPTLVVLNTGEQNADQQRASIRYDHKQTQIVALQGKIEMELAQMSDEEAQMFLAEFGISEPSLPRVIHLSYQLLGLQSFFTVGEDEVRAWTIPVGATAVEAAGTIHTDLAKGFVRAEVVSYDNLIQSGGMHQAKTAGVLRLEGKEYVVQDGDIVHIRSSI